MLHRADSSSATASRKNAKYLWARLCASTALAGALSAALLGVGAAPAQAQTAVQRAVVLDFQAGTGLDPILGRKAADALAVELQRSGDYEIVTRQEFEAAIASQPGLRPPYNAPTQARLAGVVNARSVFSGRVVRTIITEGRSARVLIEVRQLDAQTGDYINGTQINEITDEKLQQFDNDVLVDEAINKAAFAAVRSMKQTTLPIGTVLNVTNQDIELNIGTRNGVAPGQRYTVLQDRPNRARNIVERVKTGEITIVSVEDNQSTARLSAGGQVGVRTGDKVRQIYTLSNFPISSTATSSTPVTSAPPTNRTGGGLLRRGGDALLGIAALVGLVALAGFGGGSNNNAITQTDAPGAIPIQTSASLDGSNSSIRVNFTDTLPGILRGGEVAGYLIFRSTSPSFSGTPATLIDFVRGNQRVFVDNAEVTPRREIEITELNPATGNNSTAAGRLIVNETTLAAGGNEISQDGDSVTVRVTRPPLQPGVQYFYAVARVIALRTTVQVTGGGGNQQTTTRVDLQPAVGNTSNASGGATAIPTLQLADTATTNNLDNLIVTLDGTFVRGTIDTVTVQVSKGSNFADAETFEQIFTQPARMGGNVVLNLGNIRVRNFEPGDNVFIRIGLRASTDRPGATIFSQPLLLTAPAGNDLVANRFLSVAGAGRRRGGLGTSSGGGGIGRSNTRRTPGFILRPR
jgi:hypothetical protein